MSYSYFQKSESTYAKGITDPNELNAFTIITAVKRRVGEGGWSFSIQKFMLHILDL